MSFRAATWMSHARGSSGDAGARPLVGGRDERLLHGVLGGSEVAVATDDGAEHLRCQLAKQVLGRRLHRSRAPPYVRVGRPAHHLPHLDLDAERGATRARRGRRPAGDGVGTLGGLDVDEPVAHEKLLGLGERAVGHLGRAVAPSSGRRAPAPEARGLRPPASSPASRRSLLRFFMNWMCASELLRLPLFGLVVAVAARRVHHQHEFHRPAPLLGRHTPSNAA